MVCLGSHPQGGFIGFYSPGEETGAFRALCPFPAKLEGGAEIVLGLNPSQLVVGIDVNLEITFC